MHWLILPHCRYSIGVSTYTVRELIYADVQIPLEIQTYLKGYMQL